MSRPCLLQINTAGAWRTALAFDLDLIDAEALQAAATHLMVIADPTGRARMRIATGDGLQNALLRWSADKGWVDA